MLVGEAAEGGETKWVRPETFAEQLAEVVETVAPLPGEEAMYGQIRAVLAAIGRDSELKAVFDAGKPPPVKGFWSLTMYNKHHYHCTGRRL